MSNGRMDYLIKETLRKELALGFQPAYRVKLDVEGGATDSGQRYCWGVWDHDRECFVPEFASAIAGYIQGVGVKQLPPYKNQARQKLVLHLDCGPRGEYAISSGLESTFSKGLVNLVASLGPQQSREPVKVIAKPGDDDSGKVVLCALQVWGPYGFRSIRSAFDFPKDTDSLRGLYKQAIEVVKQLDLRSWEEKQKDKQQTEVD